MGRSIKDFTFYHVREDLLHERLERIRKVMSGDDIDVRLLLASDGRAPSVERARDLAHRLTFVLDDLQKAYWLTTDYEHDDQTEELLEKHRGWQKLRSEIRSYEQEVSFDLSQAPTTLSEVQRQTVEALFYCLLWGCTCEPLERTTVGSIRKVLRATAALTPGWMIDGEHERAGLSEDDLVLREYADEVQVGPSRRWHIGSDAFEMMDMIYEVVTGLPATTLADEQALARVMASDAGREVRESSDWTDEYWRTWGSANFRLLTSLDVEAWNALELHERYSAVLKALDSCDEQSLSALEGTDELVNLSLEVWEPRIYGEGWASLGSARQRELLVSALEPPTVDADPGESLDDIDARYERELQELHEGIKSWAERMGGIDELFEQYRLFRKGFFEEGLPEGAYPEFGNSPGFSECAGRWFAEGFFELASTAIDTVLGEEGLSCIFDDEVFHRTHAYLGETVYQMERAIDNRGGRRG